MPKLNNRPPKYSKMGKYAVVYYRKKMTYLGPYGSQESKVAYHRFLAEIQENPAFLPPSGEKNVTVRELTAAFLDHAKATTDRTEYAHFRIVVLDFLDKLYGDNTPVEDFKPRCLKLVREEMVNSGRFCRRVINRYSARIVSIFAWGVENDLVQETTWRALKVVKSLSKGHPGTYDNEERQPVPNDVVRRTLPFMPPTLRAMVIVQRLTGMRPSEVFNMTVGEIVKDADPELWHYVLKSHKTEKRTGIGKIVPLGKAEQELIAPYLESKKPEEAVFSPRAAMAERNAERRANRRTKISPSQQSRNVERSTKPSRYKETYNRDPYGQAVKHAIAKANKHLPDEERIPNWFPYQLRHTAATETESEVGLDEAQAQLGHKTANTTRRYSKAQLKIRENLARNRRNPFETDGLQK